MQLVAIVGQTGSGKTSIAKRICKSLTDEDIKTIVLDPMEDKEWDECVENPDTDIFTDPESFLKTLKANKDIVFFVDECDESIGTNQRDIELRRSCHWLAKRARHNGHSGFFIMLDYTAIENPMRKQLSELIIFNCHIKEAKEWAIMFNDDELLDAENLPMLSFIKKKRGQPATHGKVTFDK